VNLVPSSKTLYTIDFYKALPPLEKAVCTTQSLEATDKKIKKLKGQEVPRLLFIKQGNRGSYLAKLAIAVVIQIIKLLFFDAECKKRHKKGHSVPWSMQELIKTLASEIFKQGTFPE